MLVKLEFQSTHPHGVRPQNKERLTIMYVSIHAPTRGATVVYNPFLEPAVFQSTHPHGVRRLPWLSVAVGISFNPRTHTGCDSMSSRSLRRKTVSIHAPTRGATMFNRSFPSALIVSIHAPTRGATCCCAAGARGHGVSIHAPTRGATKC